jgi:hypothetical protein
MYNVFYYRAYYRAAYPYRAAIPPLYRNRHRLLLQHHNAAQKHAAADNIIQKRRFRLSLQFLQHKYVHCL